MNLSPAALLLLAGSMVAALPTKHEEFAKKPLVYLQEVATYHNPKDAMRLLMKKYNIITPGKVNVSRAQEIFKAIASYISDSKKPNGEELFRAAFDYFGIGLDKVTLPKTIADRIKADRELVAELLAVLLTRSGFSSVEMSKVPVDLILAGGPGAFRVLQESSLYDPVLHRAPKALWTDFAKMQDPDLYRQMCATLKVPTLERLEESSAATLKPECIAQTKLGTSTAVATNKFADDAFAAYAGEISQQVAEKMRPQQAAAFGTKLSRGERCVRLPIHHLSLSAVKAVTLPCVLSYLMSPNANLDKKWTSLNLSMFEGLAAIDDVAQVEAFAQRLSSTDWERMSKEQVGKLLSVPLLAKNVPDTMSFKVKATVRLSGKDLVKVKNAQIIAMALTSPTPDVEILAYADQEFAAALEVKGRTGLAVLDMMDSTADKAKIVANISAKLEPHKVHACASVTTHEEYNAIKTFQSHRPTDKCLKAITKGDLDRKTGAKNPELLAKLPYERFIEIYGESKAMSKIPGPELAEIIKGDLCDRIKEAEFNDLNKDALYVIDSRCVRMLLGRFPLTTDRTVRFAAKAFEAIKAGDFTAHLSFAHISELQLPHLSVALANAKEGVLAEAGAIVALGARTIHLSAKQLASISDAALLALKIENVAPAALVSLSPKQTALFVSQFGRFSVEQVQKIGIEHAEKDEVTKVLIKSSALFSAKAREALNARLSAPRIGVNSAGVVAPSAVAIGVAAVVAGAFLF